ncbi:MAG TPA: hypothetical protein VIV65_10585 [Gemmatimonadaceae bacterium]
MVWQLDQRGFRSNQFGSRVAWELHERGKGKGLPDDIVGVDLDRRIRETCEALEDVYDQNGNPVVV